MKARLSLVVALLSSLLALLFFIGCRENSSLAVLRGKEGTVEAARGARAASFGVAAVGMSFVLGDALKTAHVSTAKLDLEDGSKLLVRQDTVLRFLAQRPKRGKQGFNVEAGEVILETGKTELLLETDGKLARVGPATRLVLGRTGGELTLAVTVGRAELEDAGASRVLTAGQSLVIAVGAALLEPSDAQPSARVSGTTVAPTVGGASADQGALKVVVHGTGVRLKSPKANGYESLGSGERVLEANSALQIDGGSRVDVAHPGGSVALSNAGAYVVGAPQGMVDIRRGALSANGIVRIRVPGGTIETTISSAFNVRTSERGSSEIQVARGAMVLRTSQGESTISAGQEAVVTAEGQTQIRGASLDYADLSVRVGDSLTVHDPRPPTAVRFEFGAACPNGGVIRVTTKRKSFAVGRTDVSLALPAGQHAYALHCMEPAGPSEVPAAKGTLTVLSDTATRPVPTRPPSTSLNVDGRTYTVTYQNQLPNLSVQWPGAPADGSYTISVQSRMTVRKFHSTAPSYTFRSGTLGEGKHSILFEGGGKFSRHTTIEIAFDNAAPKVSLSTPPELRVEPGAEVSVAGVAQPGWSVAVAGKSIALDAQQRFTEKVSMPATERALAITLTNPERGTHVYLRRASRQP